MLFILHTGQTGVERGAHAAAIATGAAIAGFAPAECRDELGPLPPDIALRLTRHPERGSRPALRGNLAIASGVLLVVPDARHAASVTAIPWLLQRIRGSHLPKLICDPHTSVADAAAWAMALPVTCGSQRVMVTGPRGTRWPDGEAVSRRLVHAIGSAGIAATARPVAQAREPAVLPPSSCPHSIA